MRGRDGDLCGAVLFPLLEADVVFDEELDELGFVVLGELSELDGAVGFSLLHSNVQL